MMNHQKKAVYLALLCVFAWSFVPVVSRMGQSNLDNYQLLFWSNLLSSVVILISIFLTKKFRGIFSYSVSVHLKFAVLGFLGSCFYYLCLYWGYVKAEGMQVLVLQYTWPIFIILLSIVILRERMTLRRWISCLFGFSGVLVILTKGDFTGLNLNQMDVTLIVLAGAFSFGLFSVLSKTIKEEPYHAVLYYFVYASVFSLLSLVFLSGFAVPDSQSLSMVLINGAVINGVTYLMWVSALRLTDSSRIAPLVFIAPVLSSLWIVLFFDEIFYPIYGVGIGLTVASGLISK